MTEKKTLKKQGIVWKKPQLHKGGRASLIGNSLPAVEVRVLLLKTRTRRGVSAARLFRARGSSWAITQRFSGCFGLQKGGAERGTAATEYGASSGSDDDGLKLTKTVTQLFACNEEPWIVFYNWTIVMTCESHLDKLYESENESSE